MSLEPVSFLDLKALGNEHALPVKNAIPTPIPTWNRACRDSGGGIGLGPGWFTIIAGKPNAGKSLLMLNLIASAAQAKFPVCCLSYEMSKGQLLTRLMAIVSGCSVRRLERGDDFDAETFTQAIHVWEHHGIFGKVFMADRPARTVTGMVDVLKEAHEEWGCQLAVVDYVQLIGRAEYPTIFERTQIVSGALQAAAFETQMSVVGLSQFNRLSLSARNDEPGTEGLKGGSLDEDADQVVMLDYSKSQRHLTTQTTNLILGKNRHGPTKSDIGISFDYQTLRVKELTAMDRSMQKIRETER